MIGASEVSLDSSGVSSVGYLVCHVWWVKMDSRFILRARGMQCRLARLRGKGWFLDSSAPISTAPSMQIILSLGLKVYKSCC